MSTIGIIGGTGFSERAKDYETVATDYGPVKVGTLEIGGKKVYFVARHRELEAPHLVNYRANVQALKKKGVALVYSVSAAGRLHERVWPGHLGAVDDVDWDDLTREMTFAEKGLLLHTSMDTPFSPELRRRLHDAFDLVQEEIGRLYSNSQDLRVGFHDDGTYFNIQGPSFSTPAREARLRRTIENPRFIGQTLVPEVQLLQEMGIARAALIMAVDHSCYPGAPPVKHADGVMHAVVKTAEAASYVLDEAIRNTPEDLYEPTAHTALIHSLHSRQVDLDLLRSNGRKELAEIIENELRTRNT
ncbi:MAG TPA: MTAP family purine nucleoside phosphorylase [Candidatus Nanoarchaeia archaeon]|nr:MTAP family purine nucleoside phosphorylase [Candidatus Nanoarchaeia archaeon]